MLCLLFRVISLKNWKCFIQMKKENKGLFFCGGRGGGGINVKGQNLVNKFFFFLARDVIFG